MIPGKPLSEREKQVLQGTARGLTDREIGKKYFIDQTTVKGHIQRIKLKLGALSRPHAVAIAYEHGLIANLILEGTS